MKINNHLIAKWENAPLYHKIKEMSTSDQKKIMLDIDQIAGDVPTIGFGTTVGVTEDTVISAALAVHLLNLEVASLETILSYEAHPWPGMSENQRQALTSLVYNIGGEAFLNSKARRCLNQGDEQGFLEEAFNPIIGFVKFKGRVLRGLQLRRKEERELWQKNYR